MDRLWFQSWVHSDGEPARDGFGCLVNLDWRNLIQNGASIYKNGKKAASPDFIIKDLGPASFDHADNARNPKADLIGDVKRQVSTIVNKMESSDAQFPAIMNYARTANRHQKAPIALFVTLYGGSQSDLAKIVREGVTQYQVYPLVAIMLGSSR